MIAVGPLSWRRVLWTVRAVLCAFLAFATIGPWPGDRKGEASRYRCLSNLKQVVTSSIVYSTDHDDRLPDRDGWVDATLPYTMTEQIYHCPERHSTPGAYGYAFNSFLGLRSLSTKEHLETIPQQYDSINLARNASDPFLSLCPATDSVRTRQVGFPDGHVKSYGKEAPRWHP
jgi:hypothetical protein